MALNYAYRALLIQERRQKQENNYSYDYNNRTVIDVSETEQYTHSSAWGHTVISKRIINMRPPELRDYRLPILPHEIEHNVDPYASEALVQERAFNPERDILRKQFRLRYR